MQSDELASRAANAAGTGARPELKGIDPIQTVLWRDCVEYHRLAVGAEPEWWIRVLEGTVREILGAWDDL